MLDKTLNKIKGAIFGQAIGDALGSQTEFNKASVVTDLAPTWGYPYPAFSDDTQNFLAIAEAFRKVDPRYDSEQFMKVFSNNLVLWDEGGWGANNRSPGGTCMGSVGRLRRGVDWRESGSTTFGKGNGGGAMRAAAAGVALWSVPSEAFRIASLTAIPTHNNPETQISAGATAFLVACSIKSVPFDTAIMALFSYLQMGISILPEYTHSNEDIPFALGRLAFAYSAGKARLDDREFRAQNGNDGKGIECLAAAIFHNVKQCRYRDVIVHTANFTGDSDSTSACAGAIAGARWGYEFIPSSWRRRIEKAEYLDRLAVDIWEKYKP